MDLNNYTITNIKEASYDQLKLLLDETKTECLHRLKSEKLSFSRVLDLKDIVSSQKFSHWFQKELTRILKLTEEPALAIHDMQDTFGDSYELKYATYSYARGASFPQIIRLDHQPDKYVIVLFIDDDIRVFVVPGAEMHESVIRQNATRAHNDDENELRINIKLGSKEMAFLEKHSNAKVKALLMEASYNPIS